MLPTEQPQFFRLVTEALAQYVREPAEKELVAWWLTCKVFTLRDVERSLAAHVMDTDDGKRPPRPIDVKRRLASGAVEVERHFDPHFAERVARHLEMSKRSPSVIATAHAIALRHGNKPWQATHFEAPKNLNAQDEEPGAAG